MTAAAWRLTADIVLFTAVAACVIGLWRDRRRNRRQP
jgi:hypothetical protein